MPEEVAANVADLARAMTWTEDEAGLLTELQEGSETAFNWLVTHYHGPIFSLLLNMLDDRAEACDATQEVFLKAYRGIRGFRRGSSLKTWLYRIAIRQALNQRRWSWRHLRGQMSLETSGDGGRRMRELEAADPSPFDSAAAHEVQELVQRALASVPEPFRSAVILRDLEGLAYEEVAEVLDVSVGTVKSRILRGRRALRDILDPVLNGDAPRRNRSAGPLLDLGAFGHPSSGGGAA